MLGVGATTPGGGGVVVRGVLGGVVSAGGGGGAAADETGCDCTGAGAVADGGAECGDACPGFVVGWTVCVGCGTAGTVDGCVVGAVGWGS